MASLAAFARALSRHDLFVLADREDVRVQLIVVDGQAHTRWCRLAGRAGEWEALPLTTALRTPAAPCCEANLADHGNLEWATVRALLHVSEKTATGRRKLDKPAAQRGKVAQLADQIEAAANGVHIRGLAEEFSAARLRLRREAADVARQLRADAAGGREGLLGQMRLELRRRAPHRTLDEAPVLVGLTRLTGAPRTLRELLVACAVADPATLGDRVVSRVPRFAADQVLLSVASGTGFTGVEAVTVPDGADDAQLAEAARTWAAHVDTRTDPRSDLARCVRACVAVDAAAEPVDA